MRQISTNLPEATYTITVGAGGKGGRNGDDTASANGQASLISNATVAVLVRATGGGRGSSENPNTPPGAGGSGGGGGHMGGLMGANGTSGEGNKGGDGANPDVSPWPCGGGGGAGGAGGNGSGSTPGAGGAGTNLSISGSPVTYAAGGKGGWRTTTYTDSNGVANTGNGGEGGGSSSGSGIGGNGGSGIVIVRYVTGGAEPNADSDGDGLSDAAEAIAGTDPNSASSCLAMVGPTNTPSVPGGFVVCWASIAGKKYTLMGTMNLMTGFTNLMPANIAATPPLNIYTDIVESAMKRFYRVRVD